MFFNKYGLDEIGLKLNTKVKGKTVLDCGAYTGDSACMFVEYYEIKNVFAFEPDFKTYEILQKFITKNNLHKKIIPFQKGVGDKKDYLKIYKGSDTIDAGASFSNARLDQREFGEKIEITTIDHEVKKYNLKVGVIKLDIEGFEKKAIEGAINTVKEQKPILIISLYHNPVDFFEIKPLLDKLDLGYRFIIRRSEVVISLGDIVLIAY